VVVIGQRLGGKYDIRSEIGRGGMGIVYKAYDVMLQRPVAVKVLAPQLAVDPQFFQRFQQEAVTAANLRHPHIVTIHDVGAQPMGDRFGQSIQYIVMEYLEGVTLDQWLHAEGRKPSPAQAEHIVRQVADALQFAHDRGVIHRDVKPSNIMLDPAGRITLMDFGLVRAGEGTGLTRSGLVMGTPEYMAPEQAMGGAVDRRTDIYSLGVVIYKLLAGQVPFVRTTPVATAHAHVYEAPPPLREARPDLSRALEAVVMKALAKDPAQRYQQVSDLAADFAVAVTGKIPAGLKVTAPVERKATPKPIVTPPVAQKATSGPADPTRLVGAAAAKTQAETANAGQAARQRWPLGKPSLLAGLALLILALGLGAVLLSLDGGGASTSQGGALKPPQGALALPSATATLAVALKPAATMPASPTPTPTASATAPRATDTATSPAQTGGATATPASPTSTPVATKTPTAAPTPTVALAAEPAPTAAATRQPAATSQPSSGQAAPAPQLSQPADGQRFDGPIGDVVLRWDPIDLPEGACYVVAVRFRHNADTWSDVHCLAGTQLALPAYLADNATDSRFEWQVAVMRPKGSAFTSEADGEPLGPPSQSRTFFWFPPASSGGGSGSGVDPAPTRPAPEPTPTRP
jgi:serine/threonine-protein kinase